MIFSNKLLENYIDYSVRKQLYREHPYETILKDNEKSPAYLAIESFFKFFDHKSHDIKQAEYNARLDLINNCFKDEYLGFYPNSLKIEQCMKNAKLVHMGKFNESRAKYFANITKIAEDDIGNCPSNDKECPTKAMEKYLWNAVKGPFLFKDGINNL